MPPRSPWKSELGTHAHPPSGERPTVVGNAPTCTRPSSESVSVENFQIEPYGVPWAMETYQNRPSGETATLCGPSGSVGMTPTGTSRTFRHPAGPTSIRGAMSPLSLETYRVYGTAELGAGAPCAERAVPAAPTRSAARSERGGMEKNLARSSRIVWRPVPAVLR